MSRKRKVSPKRKGAARAQAAPVPARPGLRPGAPDAVVALLLLALVLSAYGGTIAAPFVYDDLGSIVENASVHWGDVGVEELRAAWLRSPTRRLVANWSFGVNHRFFGLDARAYHATNVMIHGAACVLLYWLLLKLLWRSGTATLSVADARLAAALAAGIFAVHPVGTQAVTYVVQRMASLAALFCVVSILLYMRGRERAGRSRVGWWVGSAAAWGVALASKESAATFPAVIALYDWLFYRGAGSPCPGPTGRGRGARCAGRARGHAVQLCRSVSGLLLPRLYAGGSTAQPGAGHWLLRRVDRVAPRPSRLTLMHDFAPSRDLFSPWTTLPAWLALAGTLFWAARSVDRRPLCVFALGWFGLALAVRNVSFSFAARPRASTLSADDGRNDRHRGDAARLSPFLSDARRRVGLCGSLRARFRDARAQRGLARSGESVGRRDREESEPGDRLCEPGRGSYPR